MLHFRKRFPGKSMSVRDARREVMGFATMCGFSRSACLDIESAVGEACANAVEHGYTRTRGFCVACGFDQGVLSVEVRDFHAGPPWSAESKASHVGAVKSEGGLGLLMINALTDEWHLGPADRGGSILTFRIGQVHATSGVSRSATHARR